MAQISHHNSDLDQLEWHPNRSDFPLISWHWYRTWPSPNYERFPWSVCNGCGMPAGNAYPSGTCFRPAFSDLLMLQLLRPVLPNLPCLFSTFHLEYISVPTRFCLVSCKTTWRVICNQRFSFHFTSFNGNNWKLNEREKGRDRTYSYYNQRCHSHRMRARRKLLL